MMRRAGCPGTLGLEAHVTGSTGYSVDRSLATKGRGIDLAAIAGFWPFAWFSRFAGRGFAAFGRFGGRPGTWLRFRPELLVVAIQNVLHLAGVMDIGIQVGSLGGIRLARLPWFGTLSRFSGFSRFSHCYFFALGLLGRTAGGVAI